MTHDTHIKEALDAALQPAKHSDALLLEELQRDLPKAHALNDWPIGVAALCFGLPFWFAGAKLTTDGWIVWLNAFAHWLGLTAAIPPVAGSGLLCAFAIGLLYSKVEVKHRPFKFEKRKPKFAPLLHWVVWCAIIATDIASTYTGLRTPISDQTFLATIAQSFELTLTASVLVTFAPEWLITAGYVILRKRHV